MKSLRDATADTVTFDYFSPTLIDPNGAGSAPWTDHRASFMETTDTVTFDYFSPTLIDPNGAVSAPWTDHRASFMETKYSVPWSFTSLPPKPQTSIASILCLIDLFVILSSLVISTAIIATIITMAILIPFSNSIAITVIFTISTQQR
ncbi:hypothetical protein TREES_T100017006 [Tupaia chinensis]|uniref:Uncharacterized protein n=1 Tax=Tupaia chinensis TaxID=246437 RepID=L9KVM0_TUPCH|nr:hypothetical protein TREES_T100017006 [Tupaia chinensis]